MLLTPSLPVSWSDPSCPFVRLVCFVLSPSTSGFRSSMSSACYVSPPTRYPLPRHPNPPERIHHPQSSGHLSFVICRWLNDFPCRNIHYHTTTALVCEDKTSHPPFLCFITVTNGPFPSFRTVHLLTPHSIVWRSFHTVASFPFCIQSIVASSKLQYSKDLPNSPTWFFLLTTRPHVTPYLRRISFSQ